MHEPPSGSGCADTETKGEDPSPQACSFSRAPRKDGSQRTKARSSTNAPSSSTSSEQTCTHHARPHADRARQFMPFAALKGYYELVRQQERVGQPRHQPTEEEATELSTQLNALRKGSLVRITYYNRDAYATIYGTVERLDKTLRTLRVATTDIPFDDILRIEPG